MQQRRTVLAGVVVLAVVALGASAVGALTGRGSQEISEGTPGVAGDPEPGDFTAVALAIGDFDGDRFDDVLVGSALEDLGRSGDAGQVQVFLGSRRGIDATRDRIIHQGTKGVAGGSGSDDQFGTALAVGDFDGDGHDDAAVGVPGKTLDGVAAAGKVVILYGSDRGLSGRRSASLSQRPGGVGGNLGVNHRYGQSLASGDFNGDGLADLAVGAPGDTSDGVARAGGVSVVFGTTAGLRTSTAVWLTQETADVGDASEIDDRFGWSLTAGDFDGDGLEDLAVGTPGESIASVAAAGAVHVFAGSDLTLAGSDDEFVIVDVVIDETAAGINGGVEANDGFGVSLAAGDFGGDGHDDLAIGVPAEARGPNPATGVVHVLPGTSTGVTALGSVRLTQAAKSLDERPELGDDFGYALSVGDFDGDDRDDLAVGVPGERVGSRNGAGLVHVFVGRAGGISARRAQTWRPGASGVAGTTQSNAAVGRSLAAGDLDRDGRDDLVVGAPGRTVSGRNAAGSFLVIPS